MHMRISIFWVDIDAFVKRFNRTSLLSVYPLLKLDIPSQVQFHSGRYKEINGIRTITVRLSSCTFHEFKHITLGMDC